MSSGECPFPAVADECAGDREALQEAREQARLEKDIRAIIAWANTYLKKRNCPATNISSDFLDGVRLIVLCEVAFNKRVGSYNGRPRLAFHCLDNIAIAFKFCSEHNVSLLSIDAHAVASGNVKATLNVLRSLLRTLTLQGLQDFSGITSSDDSSSQAGVTSSTSSIRAQLLSWASKTLMQLAPEVQVENLWSSFADGIAFCALVESLVPGSIEVSSLNKDNAKENLALAFAKAEEHLGIPSMLKPEDFAAGQKPDEAAVEQYISMLVSAAAGNRKRQEEAAAQLALVKAKKEKEVEELRQKMEEEHKRFLLLKEATEIANEKERMLQDQLASDSAALEEYKEKYDRLLENSQKTHEMMEVLSTQENALRHRIAELEAAIEERDTKVTELSEENARLNAEIYAMHTEALDVQHQFQTEEKERLELRRLGDEPSMEVQENLESMFKASVLEQKKTADFLASLSCRKGWLMKRKIGGGFFKKVRLSPAFCLPCCWL